MRTSSSLDSNLLNPGDEGAVPMWESRSTVICSITCLSSVSCSCWDLNNPSVSANWAFSSSFLRRSASDSFLASSLAVMTILFASSKSDTVNVSNSCSIFRLPFSTSARCLFSSMRRLRSLFFSSSTLERLTQTSPDNVSCCCATTCSKSLIRACDASSSCLAAERVSSRVVWWFRALINFVLRVATSWSRSGC